MAKGFVMKLIKICVGLMLGLLLTACVQVQQPVANPARQLAISTVTDIRLELAENARFAIDPLLNDLLPHQLDQQQIQPLIQELIVAELSQQGFEYQQSPEPLVDFYVGFLVVKEQQLPDEKYNKIFKLNPGLKSVDDYEKGTLLVYILEGKNQQFAWRGAVQGFIQENAELSERKHRGAQVIKTLLTNFYHES
jgi:hypothetical protein